MTSQQAHTLEQLATRTNSTDADLLWLARLCSADEQLVHLGQVTRVDAIDMIATLQDYERYEAACAANRKLDEFEGLRTCAGS